VITLLVTEVVRQALLKCGDDVVANRHVGPGGGDADATADLG
jgi:hypothetical protein